jgi:hypothetical protein
MKAYECAIRLCALITEVGSFVYKDRLEHDCICAEHTEARIGEPQVAEEIIVFIERAVRNTIRGRVIVHCNKSTRSQSHGTKVQEGISEATKKNVNSGT